MQTIAIIIVACIAGHITTRHLRTRAGESPTSAASLPVSPAVAGLGVTLLTGLLLGAIVA